MGRTLRNATGIRNDGALRFRATGGRFTGGEGDARLLEIIIDRQPIDIVAIRTLTRINRECARTRIH